MQGSLRPPATDPSESKPKHTLINPKNFKCSTIHNERFSNYVDVTNQFVNNIAHEKVCRTLKRHKIDLYLPPTAHSTVESQTQFNKINSIFKYIYEGKEQFSLQSIKINVIWRPIKCHHELRIPRNTKEKLWTPNLPPARKLGQLRRLWFHHFNANSQSTDAFRA